MGGTMKNLLVFGIGFVLFSLMMFAWGEPGLSGWKLGLFNVFIGLPTIAIAGVYLFQILKRSLK